MLFSSPTCPIELDNELFPSITFDTETYLFKCECGEGLQLDKIVIGRIYSIGGDRVIRLIVKNEINPWLIEHFGCADILSFDA